jgi:hypothetical protein
LAAAFGYDVNDTSENIKIKREFCYSDDILPEYNRSRLYPYTILSAPMTEKPSRRLENILAVLFFLALLGLLIFSAGESAPFIYGHF